MTGPGQPHRTCSHPIYALEVMNYYQTLLRDCRDLGFLQVPTLLQGIFRPTFNPKPCFEKHNRIFFKT